MDWKCETAGLPWIFKHVCPCHLELCLRISTSRALKGKAWSPCHLRRVDMSIISEKKLKVNIKTHIIWTVFWYLWSRWGYCLGFSFARFVESKLCAWIPFSWTLQLTLCWKPFRTDNGSSPAETKLREKWRARCCSLDLTFEIWRFRRHLGYDL